MPSQEETVTSPYSAAATSHEVLKEQLRLFAFSDLAPREPMIVEIARETLSTRERLEVLLDGELNFHGHDSGYASHVFHAFAAKFPPQLPLTFIRGLTRPNDIVLDPMMGSGTTIVEAMLEGRNAIGLDLDPLARRIAQAKTTQIDIECTRSTGSEIVARASNLLQEANIIDTNLEKRFDEKTRDFIDYWFLSDTQKELMALVLAIESVKDDKIRYFLELVFSSIIITKSGGVSLARDLAHSRPHKDITKIPKNAIDQFSTRLRKNLTNAISNGYIDANALIIAADAREMPIDDLSIDLVVTSPPYANAIDYMRAHKFSLVWLGRTIDDLSELRSEYIGSERIDRRWTARLPDFPESIITQLAEIDVKKANILRKYFIEMQFALTEIYRVLRHDAVAILVVGTSNMRGIDVKTHFCLADIAKCLGFDVVRISKRDLDRNKRMMPARFGQKLGSTIEQRMHEEYVIGLLKPAIPQK